MDFRQSTDIDKFKTDQWDLDLVVEKFSYNNYELSLYRVKNLDELVDQVTDDEFNLDERLPYWAELWPSAAALSRFLLENPGLLENRNVLELGCGLGLTSMIAHRQRPLHLICTDYENAALELTRKNFELNNLEPPELKLMDWRSPDFDNEFEIILASDILYEKRFFEPIFSLFEKLLARDGLIILAEPNRSIAREFFMRLKERRYTYNVQFVETWQSGQKIVVSIYLIKNSS
jgi:predicted nicotinamide N-methyase